MQGKRHKSFMAKAIELARKAEGRTFPNPLVGAVLVRNGKIIGEGYHKKVGTSHAEVIALKRAKGKLENSTLYVNLEPCCHYGRTPPCTNGIIKSGVEKVYAAMKDPNPLVNGRGFRILRENGIKVKVGILRREAKNLNRIYLELIKQNQV